MAKYKTYTGRKSKRKLLLALALAGGFAVLCIFVLPNYVTWNEDGLSINFPFFSGSSDRNPPAPTPSGNPGVEFPSPLPDPPTPPSPSPSPEPVKLAVRALFIPLAALGDAEELTALRDGAAESGFSALVLEYKTEEGIVIEDAALAEALAFLSGPPAELTASITAAENDDLVALIETAFEAGFDRVLLRGIEPEPAAGLCDVFPGLPIDIWVNREEIEPIGEFIERYIDFFERVYTVFPADVAIEAEEPFIPVISAEEGETQALGSLLLYK